MMLVSAGKIAAPKVVVSPPRWLMLLVWLILLALYAGLTLAPFENITLHIAVMGLYSMILLALIMKQLSGHYLETLQVNSDGLFFQSTEQNKYYHLPWPATGKIEKSVFSQRKGLRVEVLGNTAALANSFEQVGNVVRHNKRTYIYTKAQMRNRDKLIADILSYRPE